MNFIHSLKGPTPKTGIYSPNDSLVLYSENNNCIQFNTDSIDNYKNSITMVVKDEVGNVILAVDYLDNRIKNDEIFGIKLHDTDHIRYGAFAYGTYNICLCSVNDLKLN